MKTTCIFFRIQIQISINSLGCVLPGSRERWSGCEQRDEKQHRRDNHQVDSSGDDHDDEEEGDDHDGEYGNDDDVGDEEQH